MCYKISGISAVYHWHVKESQINNPAQVFLAVDSSENYIGSYGNVLIGYAKWLYWRSIRFPKQFANMLFCDYHVAPVPMQNEPGSTGRPQDQFLVIRLIIPSIILALNGD